MKLAQEYRGARRNLLRRDGALGRQPHIARQPGLSLVHSLQSLAHEQMFLASHHLKRLPARIGPGKRSVITLWRGIAKQTLRDRKRKEARA